MKVQLKAWAVIALIGAGTHPAEAQIDGPKSRGALAAGTYAFTNVNVVPMTSNTMIRNATVMVTNGRITAVGPAARVRIPAGTRTIDVTGKTIVMETKIDPAMIGGGVVRFGDSVIDGSVRSRLAAIRNRLRRAHVRGTIS